MNDTKSKESTAELVHELTGEISRLVRDEFKLAQIEMKEKSTKAGTGIGLFGVTGVLTLAAVACLTTALIAGLATAMSTWAAALVAAAILVVLAGVSAMVGKSQVKQAAHPVPEKAVDEFKDDIRVIKESAKK